jgi:hypothetical protein
MALQVHYVDGHQVIEHCWGVVIARLMVVIIMVVVVSGWGSKSTECL